MLCVVPLIGRGTPDDPRRPLFAPATLNASDRSGILGYTMQESDDGKFALVEFVARNQAAFAAILDAHTPGVKVFLKGRDKREDVEAEFKKYKKDFDFSRFGVRVP